LRLNVARFEFAPLQIITIVCMKIDIEINYLTKKTAVIKNACA